MAAQIKLLSAGAVKPALVRALEQFRNATGAQVSVSFATAPQIRQLLLVSESVDVVIAPTDLIDELAKAGKIEAADLVTLGRIGVGVMVRDGMPAPQISSVEALREALLKAESIVYNQASTGNYLEGLFSKLGIATAVKNTAIRYADFAAVLEHIRTGRGDEIGFGATTVIVANSSRGIRFVGPLPAEIQNYTAYAAVVAADCLAHNAAAELVAYLNSPIAKRICTGVGME